MSDTPPIPALEIATFKALTGPSQDPVKVHFNPASLQYTVSNQADPNKKDKNADGLQYVSQAVAKLTMDLIFDTTLPNDRVGVSGGEDVRTFTDQMAKLMQPFEDGGGKVPPRVEFGWGVYRFVGIIEQYKETLDFFAAGGVPLRAAINLTLTAQKAVFESNKNPNASVDGNLTPEPAVVPSSGGPAGAANALGDPRAARAIASANASASLRFGGEVSLAIGANVSLGAPAAFATGGAGLGIGVGGGIGVGAGIGIGAGAGIGIGGSAGIGIGASAGIGISGSAGITATAGAAFSGLRVGTSSSASLPNPKSLLPTASASASLGAASFGAGGMASAGAGGSLSVDIGATADLHARIGFD
jgi:hypothetical protein